MELTAAAQWLNDFFLGYDSAILGALHSLAQSAGTVLTPLMKLITLLGEKGLVFFILAVVFACFARTRDLGVCIFGAVCCGALITNIILKDNIARPRPFETVEQFRQWWQFVGAPAEDGFSFPSGHVTAAAAGMTAAVGQRRQKVAGLPGQGGQLNAAEDLYGGMCLHGLDALRKPQGDRFVPGRGTRELRRQEAGRTTQHIVFFDQQDGQAATGGSLCCGKACPAAAEDQQAESLRQRCPRHGGLTGKQAGHGHVQAVMTGEAGGFKCLLRRRHS